MPEPREDANCTVCDLRFRCVKFIYKRYDENGKPDDSCYVFQNSKTEFLNSLCVSNIEKNTFNRELLDTISNKGVK
jgi:hypothetical protein